MRNAPYNPNAPFDRLWLGFLNGRVLIAACLLVLQLALDWPVNDWPGSGQASAGLLPGPVNLWLWPVCLLYLALAVLLRLCSKGHAPRPQLGWKWMLVVGVDVVAISFMQWLQAGPINHAALLAIPVLIAAVLGELRVAFATTSGVAILLLGYVAWLSWSDVLLDERVFYQTGFACAGYFVVAYLTHELSQRVRRDYHTALQGRIDIQNQEKINEVIMRRLADGILVVDGRGQVRQANPAALRLLGVRAAQPPEKNLSLDSHAGWQALLQVLLQSLERRRSSSATVTLRPWGEQGQMGVQVRTWVTELETTPELPPEQTPAPILPPMQQRLCVAFLRDLREIEAQVRSEKLIGMGRMSAAVAHEIRNPLSVIVQANALLAEDETLDAASRGLCRMIGQNASRIDRTVQDILNAASVQRGENVPRHTEPLALDAHVERVCREWMAQSSPPRTLELHLDAGGHQVRFDGEHLRRILVNLLDNAQRYRSDPQNDWSLQVRTGQQCQQASAADADNDESDEHDESGESGEDREFCHLWLHVWSDGPPIDASVQRHLFEPFFSSESRSSGLGLYLSRTLCQYYDSTIDCQRVAQATPGGGREGNAFRIDFAAPAGASPSSEP